MKFQIAMLQNNTIFSRVFLSTKIKLCVFYYLLKLIIYHDAIFMLCKQGVKNKRNAPFLFTDN